MTKDDIIEAIVQKTAMAKKMLPKQLIQCLKKLLKHYLKEEKFVLTGFGTFKVNRRAAREGRNPKTGEKLQIPATNVPKFKPGKGLKDAVK